MQLRSDLSPDQVLADDMAGFYADPVGFVNYAFEWGEGDLEGFDGLRTWQEDFLRDVSAAVAERGFDGIDAVEPIQMATSSGHGIGKSALTAFLVLWIMSTRPFAKGVLTANTSDQLKTKTWAEVGKWWKRCITRHWFEYHSSRGNMALVHKQYPESWRVDAQTCREENSEAFAGLHAANSTPFYIFDEASAVPNNIWEVSDGGLTDGEPMRFVFGNPTRNSGRFFECFNKLRHRWSTRQIDSRNVDGTNKSLIDTWIDDYGEDSDFVRVRVRGVFPRAGSTQFIAGPLVDEAAEREPVDDRHAPLVIGVDVARFGDDQTVIYPRIGRDARSFEPRKFRGLDTMQTAARVIEYMDVFRDLGRRVDAVFVDGVGVGGGVVDRLRQLNVDVIEVTAGATATQRDYCNMRAQMWGRMREWLAGGCVVDDPELRADLTNVEYGYDVHGRIQLEKKEDMKKRGLASPDIGDALALTFAYPVAAQQTRVAAAREHVRTQPDYDPHAALL